MNRPCRRPANCHLQAPFLLALCMPLAHSIQPATLCPLGADEAGALSASRREENAALAPLAVATLRALLAFPPEAFRAHLKDFFPLLTGVALGYKWARGMGSVHAGLCSRSRMLLLHALVCAAGA